MNPKYKIGDYVGHPETLYHETTGRIARVEKLYGECDDKGAFVRRGHVMLESVFDSIVLPKRLVGERMEIDYPLAQTGLSGNTDGYTRVYRFKTFAYTVKTARMNALFEERRIRRLNAIEQALVDLVAAHDDQQLTCAEWESARAALGWVDPEPA